MPATVESLVDAATEQWVTWGRSTWNVATGAKSIGHTDDEVAFARLVIEQYCAVGGGNPSVTDIADDRYFWSAVGMSAAMKSAGFTKTEFPFAQSHSTFIRHFVAARKRGIESAPYWGFRLNEPGGEPQPGDIVAYARARNMTTERAAKLFDATNSYESHSDLVVERRRNEIDVIGYNVMDSVTKKTLPLGANGHIADPRHFWFVTLEHRGG
ncbi:MAG: DUF2272 domain-containing protein [Gemmatimonadaceae bacterium]|jgi:hypothetical protein|nr:DUF2272 domain-containing protein [Gemmatimonadaceae bacterium]